MSRRMIDQLVEAVERRDADGYAALFAETAVAHHPLSPHPIRGREAIRAGEQALFDAFSDVGIEVRSVLATDELCAVEVVLRATNTGPLDLGGERAVPATGRAIRVAASWWYEVGADGLVVEARDYFDTADLMDQLGLAASGQAAS